MRSEAEPRNEKQTSTDRATIRASELLITLTPTLSQRERGLFQSPFCGPLSLWVRAVRATI